MHGSPVTRLVAGLGGDPAPAPAPGRGDVGGDVVPPAAPPRVRCVSARREERVGVEDAGGVVAVEIEGGKQRVMERFTERIMAIEEVLE